MEEFETLCKKNISQNMFVWRNRLRFNLRTLSSSLK
jgi:hypothetical protein